MSNQSLSRLSTRNQISIQRFRINRNVVIRIRNLGKQVEKSFALYATANTNIDIFTHVKIFQLEIKFWIYLVSAASYIDYLFCAEYYI